MMTAVMYVGKIAAKWKWSRLQGYQRWMQGRVRAQGFRRWVWVDREVEGCPRAREVSGRRDEWESRLWIRWLMNG